MRRTRWLRVSRQNASPLLDGMHVLGDENQHRQPRRSARQQSARKAAKAKTKKAPAAAKGGLKAKKKKKAPRRGGRSATVPSGTGRPRIKRPSMRAQQGK